MSNQYLDNKYLEGIIARFQQSKKDKAKYKSYIIALENGNDSDRIPGEQITLEEAIQKHSEITEEYQELQNLLAAAFFTLSDNLANYAKFSHIDIDDAIQEGVMICFEKIDRFNPEIGKAFNYMTTCILNHFRQLYRTARNYNELKKRYHDHLEMQVNQTILKYNKSRERSRVAAMRFNDVS